MSPSKRVKQKKKRGLPRTIGEVVETAAIESFLDSVLVKRLELVPEL
jgi:hypothetical protein